MSDRFECERMEGIQSDIQTGIGFAVSKSTLYRLSLISVSTFFVSKKHDAQKIKGQNEHTQIECDKDRKIETKRQKIKSL